MSSLRLGVGAEADQCGRGAEGLSGVQVHRVASK
jgi:hypothetical protein